MERSLFKGKVWKEYSGLVGAVPINTPQMVSYDRLAPGALPPPKQPKPTKEQLKAQQAEETRQKALAELQKKQKPSTQKNPEPKQPEPPKPKVLEAEDKEKLPEFDLQDIPNAMDKIGWTISAKVARKWFASPKHIYNDKQDSLQPLDNTTVTLDWALKYGSVKDRFNELLNKDIYSENAFLVIKKKILQHVTNIFTGAKNTNSSLSFETSIINSDIRQFHIDWQVQQKKVSTIDTSEGVFTLTDLSGTLGNFFLYAAIGRVEVISEKYFKYEKKPAEYCIDSVAKLTHVYVYLKDNYSFNDKDQSNSQYLGHWNKNGMVLSYAVTANDLLGQFKPEWKSSKLNDSEEINKTKINWDYLIKRKEVDKPVDKRTGIIRKFMEKDVYWPIYNKSYREWREKHDMGGDFMIYSKPQLYKLKKPIIIKLETVCRPYDNTSTNQ